MMTGRAYRERAFDFEAAINRIAAMPLHAEEPGAPADALYTEAVELARLTLIYTEAAP